MVVILSVSVMGLIGYLAGELAFAFRPHPVHWGVALLAASIGWGIGRLYYQLKGDII